MQKERQRARELGAEWADPLPASGSTLGDIGVSDSGCEGEGAEGEKLEEIMTKGARRAEAEAKAARKTEADVAGDSDAHRALIQKRIRRHSIADAVSIISRAVFVLYFGAASAGVVGSPLPLSVGVVAASDFVGQVLCSSAA
jgi:hypothetical protein